MMTVTHKEVIHLRIWGCFDFGGMLPINHSLKGVKKPKEQQKFKVLLDLPPEKLKT